MPMNLLSEQIQKKAEKERPTTLLSEWMEAKKSEPPRKAILDRLKTKANAPSVGDEVEIQFDEQGRGYLTDRQQNLNGAKGTVKIRDSLRPGGRHERYTVEIHASETENGQPQRIHNLTPSEVERT